MKSDYLQKANFDTEHMCICVNSTWKATYVHFFFKQHLESTPSLDKTWPGGSLTGRQWLRNGGRKMSFGGMASNPVHTSQRQVMWPKQLDIIFRYSRKVILIMRIAWQISDGFWWCLYSLLHSLLLDKSTSLQCTGNINWLPIKRAWRLKN